MKLTLSLKLERKAKPAAPARPGAPDVRSNHNGGFDDAGYRASQATELRQPFGFKYRGDK